MCLYSLTPIPTIAEEDIYCYKEIKWLNGTYRTPFQYAIVRIPGKLVGKGPRYITKAQTLSVYMVGIGYIHAFRKSEYIKTRIHTMLKDKHSREHILLCKIPKGTKMYIGNIDICAQEMEVIKIIV